MNKAGWKKKIRAACEGAGTYRPFFDPVIDSLAATLEKRDDALRQYEENGGEPVIIHTNHGGHANMTKNPCLVLWNELNNTALHYWRDLGLTPAGLKKINENALAEKKSGFDELLKGIL